MRAVRVPGLRPRAHGALQDEVAERPKQARDDEHAYRDGDEGDDVVARRRPAVVVVVPTTVSRLVGRARRRLLSQGQSETLKQSSRVERRRDFVMAVSSSFQKLLLSNE